MQLQLLICQNKSRMGSPQLGLAGVEIDPSEEEGLEGVLSRISDCIGIPHGDLLNNQTSIFNIHNWK